MSLFCNNNFVKMNNLEQFNLKEAKKASLSEVLEINESHKPMLSSLGDLGKLEDLIENVNIFDIYVISETTYVLSN